MCVCGVPAAILVAQHIRAAGTSASHAQCAVTTPTVHPTAQPANDDELDDDDLLAVALASLASLHEPSAWFAPPRRQMSHGGVSWWPPSFSPSPSPSPAPSPTPSPAPSPTPSPAPSPTPSPAPRGILGNGAADSSSLSNGAIAGVVIGSIIFVSGMALVATIVTKRKGVPKTPTVVHAWADHAATSHSAEHVTKEDHEGTADAYV